MAEKFCLKWNDFERNISAAFRDIRDEKEFFDITLACDDDQLHAHKVILSACSPFFKQVLKRNPHQHPLLYLKGVSFRDMQAVLNFMYHGEVNVAQDDLNSFLQVAEDLRVKGLTQNTNSSEGKLNKSPAINQTSQSNSRRRSASEASSPAVGNKRFRADTPVKSTAESEDDIQEVIPVKSEPPSQAAVTDPGTLAMYQEEEIASDGMMVEENNFEESAYNEEFDQSEYTEQNYLVQGSDGSSGDRAECNLCGKWLHRRGLRRHIADVHSSRTLQFNCDLCNKMFSNEQYLKNHKRTTHGVYVSRSYI